MARNKFTFSSADPILQQTRVRLRRLMNEGFQGLLISLFLFSVGVTLISIYLHDREALEEAITTEILKTVGTRQEPSDGARELGLIGAALSKLNAASATEDCPPVDPTCTPVDQLSGKIAARMRGEITNDEHIEEKKGEPDFVKDFRISVAKWEGDLQTWPDLGGGSLCDEVAENTFMLLPAQMKGPLNAPYSERIVRAAAYSRHLESAIRDVNVETHHPSIVQAYFISPDSLLRIWSRRATNACQEFSRSRLWAAKSYFAYFWDHPKEDHDSTLVYIDYGGNGLVRTNCSVIERKKSGDESYSRGPLLGIVCVDAKLPDNQTLFMRRQLFFETALVSFPASGEIDPEKIVADVAIPRSDSSIAKESSAISTANMTGVPFERKAVEIIAQIGQTPRVTRAEIEENRAVEMQPPTLSPVEVQQALRTELRNFVTRPWLREITRIPFRGKTAFLLPLNISGGTFNGLFFFPRSPRLPIRDNLFGLFGFVLVGAAFASAAYQVRLLPRAVALRERLALFRNLQAGIVRVDPDDWIIECNDRAEELFARKLPKPGVVVVPVNFAQMIESRFRDESSVGDSPSNQSRFQPVTAEELARMRRSGEASWYYAALNTHSKRTWIRVMATPVMVPVKNPSAGSQVEMTEIFATITDVAPETVVLLEQRMKMDEEGGVHVK